MTTSYLTPLANVVVPRAVKLGSIWITQTPCLDPDVGLAHLTPAGAAWIAQSKGGRLPTAAEILLLHHVAAAAGTELPPFTLPDAHYTALGFHSGCPEMMSREWCVYGDSHVLASIGEIGDLGDNPVANAGKHWTSPPGSLCGWWVADVGRYDPSRRGPGFIQAGGHVVHDAGVVVDGEQRGGQRDYASTTEIVWDVDPATLPQAA